MPLDLSYSSFWTETPAHLTEGVWDRAETGNNHWEEVVKVIKRKGGHVQHLRSPGGSHSGSVLSISPLVITGMTVDFDIFVAYQRNVQNVSLNLHLVAVHEQPSRRLHHRLQRSWPSLNLSRNPPVRCS